jgi:hypothetical protein
LKIGHRYSAIANIFFGKALEIPPGRQAAIMISSASVSARAFEICTHSAGTRFISSRRDARGEAKEWLAVDRGLVHPAPMAFADRAGRLVRMGVVVIGWGSCDVFAGHHSGASLS